MERQFKVFKVLPQAGNLLFTPLRANSSAKLNIDPNKDYYRILNVSQRASTVDIKSKFYSLAKQYHPDGADNLTDTQKVKNEELFKAVASAYEVIGDKEKRKIYDEQRAFQQAESMIKNQANRGKPGFSQEQYEQPDETFTYRTTAKGEFEKKQKFETYQGGDRFKKGFDDRAKDYARYSYNQAQYKTGANSKADFKNKK